jgi:hypothetical protein
MKTKKSALLLLLLLACERQRSSSGMITLELLDPGAQPGRNLAYVGAPPPATAQLTVEMFTGKDGDRRSLWRGPATIRYQVSPEKDGFDLAAQGATIALPADTSPAERQAIEPLVAQFGKVSLDVNVEGKGLSVVVAESPMRTMPSLPELLNLMIVPLPYGTVGVGARWAVESKEAIGKSRVVTRRDYQLLELTATGARLSVTGTISSGPTPTVTMSGSVTIALADALPREAQLTLVETIQPGLTTEVVVSLRSP